MLTKQQLVDGYAQIILDRSSAGWQSYLLTFMFHHISGPPSRVQSVMCDEIERVYAKILPRIVRKPKSVFWNNQLPVLLAFPDVPVAKRAKKTLREVTVNEGLHYHGVLAVAPNSRMKGDVAEHLADNEGHYLRKPLQSIHAVTIGDELELVLDYIMKQLKRGVIGPDDVLIMPRALSELHQTRRSGQICPPRCSGDLF